LQVSGADRLTCDLAQLWEYGPALYGDPAEPVQCWAFARPLDASELEDWGDASAVADHFAAAVLVVAMAIPSQCTTERYLLFYPKGEALPDDPGALLTFADERCERALISTGSAR
jgi:hypothetical protein